MAALSGLRSIMKTLAICSEQFAGLRLPLDGVGEQPLGALVVPSGQGPVEF